MLRNHIKVAIRHLLRNKTFSLINISGLTVATLCCLYMLMYVKNEYSYDRHHKDAKDIYRITSYFKSKGGESNRLATTSPPVAPAMKNDFSEVKQYTRVVSPPGVNYHLFSYNNRSFYETKGLFVDSTFFQVFTYHFVYGTPYKALNAPYTIVLTEATAEKLFGKADPVGKLMSIDNSFGKHDFTVTGVVNDDLGPAHISANFFISMNSGGIGEYVMTDDSWAGNNFISAYVKLQPGSDAAALDKKLPAFLDKYGAQQLKDRGMDKALHLQPLIGIHTTPGYQADIAKPVSPVFLYILLFIAGLIQVIACINFMNLSTARSFNRAKEVGVRKAIGANRDNLIKQFLTESAVISILSMVLAIPLLWIGLPILNEVAGVDLKISAFYRTDIIIGIAGIIIVTGLFAGSYPAFYLSAFKAIKVLKGNIENNFAGINLRKGLVVFQFVLSVILIIGIIVINRQLHFINNMNVGFEKEQKVIITFRTAEAKMQMPALKNRLLELPQVKNITSSNNYPGQFIFNDVGLHLLGQDPASSKIIRFMMSDEGFLKTLGIRLIKGRDLSAVDSGKVILNEAALAQLGLTTENAVGTRLYGVERQFEVIGVMQDFNFSSLHEKIDPFMIMNPPGGKPEYLSNMIVAVNSNDYEKFLSKVSAAWKTLIPSAPFEYAFLDEQVQKQYSSEITLSKIINAFTLIAIIICCLGLFGLAAFTAERRTKEIGIRKVLGASVPGIVTLLSRDFLILVVISVVIASPIAWFAMNKWLGDFAYRINIRWWIFLVAGLIAVIIAFITVSFQALRAALSNPVNSLRNE
jgi:putative ABC transport system permease protein